MVVNLCIYISYQELRRGKVPGIDFAGNAIDSDSSLLIAALHGDGIEQGTSEIARALAGEEFSSYVFKGVIKYRNRELPIASTPF